MEKIEVGTVVKFENGNEAVVTEMFIQWPFQTEYLRLVNKAENYDCVRPVYEFVRLLASPPFGDQSKAEELAGGRYQCPFCGIDVTGMIDEDEVKALQVDSFECPGCHDVITSWAASEIMLN